MLATRPKSRVLARLAALLLVVCTGLISLVGSGGGGAEGFGEPGNPTCTGIFDVVDAFGFRPVVNAPLDTPITSNTATIEGFCSAKDITITGPGEYSINGGPYTNSPGKIVPNSSLVVRITSAPTFGTTRSARVAIGDHLLDPTATFSVTTSAGSPANAPTVEILTPLDQQVFNAETLIVAGRASDPDGIASITVNGVNANTNDGFANWWAQISLNSGLNLITVASADTLLNTNPAAAQVEIDNLAVILAVPVDLAVDAINSRILVIDAELRALVAVDIASGDVSMISDADRPDNLVAFIEPVRLAVNASATTAWVIDHAYEDLIVVDLSTGSRSLLVDTVAPDPGESLQEARDIALDEISNQALLLVGGLNSAVNDTRIISANLANGDRAILSDGSTPNSNNPFGTLFSGMSEVFDGAGFRLLVMQTTNLLAVDPLTGDRTVFSPSGVESAIDATLDLLSNRAIILNRFSSNLYGADLNSGNLELLWPVSGGFNPQRIAFDPLNNRTLVLFLSYSEIFAVDMLTGESSVAY